MDHYISPVQLFFYKKLVVCLMLIMSIFHQHIYAQEVEHNYKVGLNYVDCDSIKLVGLSDYSAIITIRAGIYRFHQNFRLSRKQGVQSGEFYSCNAIQGYLIIKYNNREFLYVNVDKRIWDELIGNQDPEGFYLKMVDEIEKFPE